MADEPARGLRSATQVLRQFKAVGHVTPPGAALAALSGEAQVVPNAEPDGSYLCPECGRTGHRGALALAQSGVPRYPASARGVSGADELRSGPAGLPGSLVQALEKATTSR